MTERKTMQDAEIARAGRDLSPEEERLYRIRHLHQGKHSVYQPTALRRLLWLNLMEMADTS